jgi:hypothetical protein
VENGYAHIAQMLRRRIAEWWEQGQKDFSDLDGERIDREPTTDWFAIYMRFKTLARCANDLLPILATVEALAEKEGG